MKNKPVYMLITMVIALGLFQPILPVRSDSVQPQDCKAAAQIANDRAVKAENELSAARLELKTCEARHTEELAKANGAVADAERDLASVRKLSTALAQESQQRVTTLEKAGNEKDATIAATGEALSGALQRIHRADRANLCRAFRIGCVPKKRK